MIKITIKGMLLAFLICLAIAGVWYGLEWIEFGELQWDRECDNIISCLYFCALCIGYSRW